MPFPTILVVVAFAAPIIIFVTVVCAVLYFVRRADRERQLLRMEVGKLADEVQKLREQQGGGS